MKSVNTKQLAVIAGILVVIVLLLLANTKLPKKDEKMASSEHQGGSHESIDITGLVESAKKTLSAEQKQLFEKLEQEAKSATDKKSLLTAITSKWDSLRQPGVAAYYVEQAALAAPTEQNWMDAANRYYVATRFVSENEKPVLYKKAMECFEKTLQLNPKNVEAKVNLASCYVEGTPDPMTGIGMLKEIEKTDSNNINLQLNFAFFSEKSGQWDKAIARFKKVLKIQPDFIEAYLHLADAYERKGDKEGALESLKKYMSLVDDVTIKAEVQNYIDQLSKGNSLEEKQKQ